MDAIDTFMADLVEFNPIIRRDPALIERLRGDLAGDMPRDPAASARIIWPGIHGEALQSFQERFLAYPRLVLMNIPSVVIPPSIGALDQLRLLIVSKHGWPRRAKKFGCVREAAFRDQFNLRRLPPEIGNLTRLEWMRLSFARIAALPPEIGRLTNLRELDLSRTAVTELPPAIAGLPNLQSLYLGKDQGETISPDW